MKKIAFSLFGLVWLLSLTGCNSCNKKTPEQPSLSEDKIAQLENKIALLEKELDSKLAALQAERQKQDVEEASYNLGSNEKLGTYIRCYNFISNKVEHAVNAYLQWAPKDGLSADIMKKTVQARGGKTGHPFPFPIMETNFPAACPMRIEDAVKLKPAQEKMDPLAQKYAEHLKKMVDLFGKMNAYYRAEDYNKDNGEQGVKYHKELLAANEAFSASLQALGGEISQVENKQLHERLAQLNSVPGKKLPALLTSFVAETKTLVDLMENTVWPAVEKGLSPEALDKFSGQLTKVKNELNTLVTFASAYERKMSGPEQTQIPKEFYETQKAGENFIVEAETFIKRYSKPPNERYTPSEWEYIDKDLQELVVGTPLGLMKSRSELIRRVNSTRFPYNYNDAIIY